MTTATRSTPPPATEFSHVILELISELGRVSDGFVEVRIYKSNNALENHDITTHKRNKGRIKADFAAN